MVARLLKAICDVAGQLRLIDLNPFAAVVLTFRILARARMFTGALVYAKDLSDRQRCHSAEV